jgi:UDP-galactopyranose mutase
MNTYKADLLIIGCGLAGVTFARLAAENGITCHIVDKRNHIGGNCYTYTDSESQVEVHKYGPHIFHTNSKEIWDFINRFTKFNYFINRIKASYNGRIYSLPINLHTINQYYDKTFSPKEAQYFIEGIRHRDISVTNFEEFILNQLGQDLYEAFYKYYTIKQWETDPKNIPIATAKRLPIRFNYNDNYFNDIYQGIPIDGYTKIFERMLDIKGIKVILNSDFQEYEDNWRNSYKKLIYTGSIDEYFDYKYGALPYRTVTFREIRDTDIIGISTINFTDMSVPYTRIHEHKWYTPEKKFEKSIGFEEYSHSTDSRKEPYYPVRNIESDKQYNEYFELTANEKNVIFIGRLAEFRYYDMHQVIGSSIGKFKSLFKE